MTTLTREQLILKRFGRNIQRIRQDREFSQQEIADKIDMSLTYISYIETGKRWPKLITLEKLAKALDVKILDFFVDIDS